jgi:endonuclease/exonuclease/phosphatase family metal-dependent hydrolase
MIRIAWLMAVALFLVPGCDKSSDSSVENGMDTGVSQDVKTEDVVEAEIAEQVDILPRVQLPYSFIDFNTGLAHNYIPYPEERRTEIILAMAESDARFVCLQEVWEPEDVAQITAGLSADYPYIHTADTTEQEGDSDPACTEEETSPLLECVLEFCSETEDLTQCVLDNCGDFFLAVTEGCQTCLAANIAKSIDDIITACLEGSASFVYEGRNGLLLASREEFVTTDFKKFDAFLFRRVVLHAEVATEAGPLHLYCTHLAANMSEVEYHGRYASYEAEQNVQIISLLNYVKKTAGEAPAVIMGDMNCGPAMPGVDGNFEGHFAKFATAGFDAPYVMSEEPGCTWCESNTMVEKPGDHIIDHIFTGNFPDFAGTPVANRIYDAPVTLTTSEGEVESNLSDHFGIQVRYPQTL